MRPYSNDLRTRVVQAYEKQEGSQRELARRFGLSLSCVHDLLKRFRQTGRVDPKPHGGGHPPKIPEAARARLRRLVEQFPDATLAELREKFQRRCRIVVSQWTIGRVVRQEELTRKKKTFRAAEQDSERVKGLRQEFAAERKELASEDLVFIDEAGINRAMTRLYARAPRGERAYAARPVNYGENVTMLGALSLQGLGAAMTIRGSTNGEVFRTYVEQVLVPTLRPGQIVLLDHLKAHKVAGVQEAIEAVGARVQFLPPYSPDYSPIEPCWSKVKNYLRGLAARTYQALERGVTAAIGTITAEDVRGWFTHCGYCTASK